MNRLVITGIGPVSPIGIGKEHFWHAVKNGDSGMKMSNRFPFFHETYYGELTTLNFDEYIYDKRFRRTADISKYVLTSAILAINDSRRTISGKETAFIMGTTHGALNYTQAFHSALIREGAEAVSPIFFSDSVLNAPASNASICFDIRGPVHTLIGGGETALKSVMLACRIIANGEANRALVVSAEELNELSFACHARMGINSISEGAGAILIEKEDDIRGLSPYCYISGMASRCNPLNPEAALINVISKSIEKTNLKLSDVDIILTDSDLPAERHLKDKFTGSIMNLTGNAFSVAAMWNMILASLSIKNGSMPKTVVKNKVSVSDVNNIMICTSEKHGAASAIILSKNICYEEVNGINL